MEGRGVQNVLVLTAFENLLKNYLKHIVSVDILSSEFIQKFCECPAGGGLSCIKKGVYVTKAIMKSQELEIFSPYYFLL